MICRNCGVDNSSDSLYCKGCGSPMGPEPASAQPQMPPPPKDFGQEMADVGKRFGENLKSAGEEFGREMGKSGNEFRFWWDYSFGILAPVVGAAILMIVFFGAILVVGSIGEVSDHPAFWHDLAQFMEDYFWLFFALIFLGSFQGYFHRRYRQTFKWINPIVSGIGFVAWLWIFAQVIHFAAIDADHPKLQSLSNFVVDVLPVVFILVVVVGYLIVFFGLVSPANWDRKKDV